MEPSHNYEEYFDTSEQQVIHHQAQGLAFALSLLLLVFIYLPLLTIGYIVSFYILSPRDSAFAWIGSILFFAGVSYMVIQSSNKRYSPLRANN